MNRAVLVVAVLAGLMFGEQAHAANQKVTFTKTSGAYSNIAVIITIGGVQSDWILLVDGYRYSAASVQTQLNAKYGAGRFLVTYPTTTSVMLEFIGAYGDQAVAYTHVGRWIDGEYDSGVSTQYTHTLTQAGSAPPPPPDPDPEPTPASDEMLAILGEKLEAIGEALEAHSAAHERLTFLGQSIAQTMGLICGGLLWRTIVVAARLK
jgi:hypothetical protein